MAGVYVSYPFCAQKCTYCNFASGLFPADVQARYGIALLDEVAQHNWAWPPESVYIGGGTPSLAPAELLAGILRRIPIPAPAEVTLEAAPGTLQPERIEGWAAMGINRVSLGVQSMVALEVARTGRKHTAAIVAAEIAALRGAGIANINIDLIAGLAGQTRESWRESLEGVIALGVPHVSVYMLEVDEDSRLGLEILNNGGRYGAREIPSDDDIVWFYETAVEQLAAAGITRYEISNFARPGFESRHNLKYWRLEPYIGFGADAHSYDGKLRWSNVEDAREYVGRWERGREVRSAIEPADGVGEPFYVGLRLADGIAFRGSEAFDERIAMLIGDGLLESTGQRLRLTRRGVLLSNEVFQEFLPA